MRVLERPNDFGYSIWFDPLDSISMALFVKGLADDSLGIKSFDVALDSLVDL